MQGDDRPAPLNCLCLFHCKKHADTPRDLPSDQKVLPSRKGRSAATACPAALIRLQEYAILAEVMTFFSDLPTAGQRVAGRNGGRRFFRARLIESRQGRHKAELPEDNTEKMPTLLSMAPIKRPKLWQPAETLACVMRRSSDAAMRGGDFPVPLHPASSTARERRHATSQISAPAAAQPHSIVGEGRDPLPGTALTGKFVARIVFPAKEDVGRELFPAHSRSFVSLRRFYGEGIFLCPGKAALFRRLSAANARRQAFMPAAAILFGIPREDLTAADKNGLSPAGPFHHPDQNLPENKSRPKELSGIGARRTRRNAQRAHCSRRQRRKTS